MTDPKISDNDSGEISATVGGVEVRAWSYGSDAERRIKMRMAHEFAEGWFQAEPGAIQRIKDRLDTRLNDYLCEMKPNYDDSITGFNEAWDIMRKLFAGTLSSTESPRDGGK